MILRVAQRCGRYAYRKVAVRVTNPDHYEAHPGKTGGDKLAVCARYAHGRTAKRNR